MNMPYSFRVFLINSGGRSTEFRVWRTMNVWLDVTTPAVVDSELTGVTLFDSWEQKASRANKNGNMIEFSASGVWYYKLFVNGIGDFYSYTGSFSGTYNVTTGVGDLNIL